MELYTSLTRLKMALTGGDLPSLTPLPDEIRAAIDPAFTIGGDGWGGLVEDEARGLRCPVRGCGAYFHRLAWHVDNAHPEIGGAVGLRALMSIPSSASLNSTAIREHLSAQMRTSVKRQHLDRIRVKANAVRTAKRAQAKGRETVSRDTRTVGRLNLADACPAQFVGKLAALHAKLGRTPTAVEASAEYGSMIVSRAVAVFGSWNAAIAYCGFEPNARGNIVRTKREEALDALRAWVDAHGDLPTDSDVSNPSRLPLILGRKGILTGLGCVSWPAAMKIAAMLLNLPHSRYAPDWLREQKSA